MFIHIVSYHISSKQTFNNVKIFLLISNWKFSKGKSIKELTTFRLLLESSFILWFDFKFSYFFKGNLKNEYVQSH